MADTSIKVCVRFRPQNSREKAEGGQVCVAPKGEMGLTITTTEGGTKPPQEKDFGFDRVFMMDSAQDNVFNYVAKPVLDDCFAGFNGTIFAYGQTGSGKTHTMMGTGINDPVGRGIIPRVMFSLFEHISSAPPTTDFVVKVNYTEIYMEKVKDLIDTTKSNLSIREDPKKGIYIQDVTDTYIASPQDAFDVMATGDRNRVVAFTQMNAGSSRSHSIFTLNIEVTDNSKGTVNISKLNLVDLAGSEKIAKTGAEGQQLEEAKKINQSLSALGNVINALTDPNSKHVPYRDSKLTRILQESLGGNAKTTLIVCCSCSSWNDFETVSSLRFGMRAKSIKNKVEANTELSKDQMKKIIKELEIKIRNYEDYIKYLEGGGVPDPSFKNKGGQGGSQANTAAPAPLAPSSTGSSLVKTEVDDGSDDNGGTQNNNPVGTGSRALSPSGDTGQNVSGIQLTQGSTDAMTSPTQITSPTLTQSQTSSTTGASGPSEPSPASQVVANEYIHSLQEKLITLETTVQSTTNELESYKMLHDDLYAELVSGEEARTQLEKELEELRQKNEDIVKGQEKAKSLTDEYNTLKELYASITAEHEEETTELANEIDSLRNELTQKRIELRNLQNKLEISPADKGEKTNSMMMGNEAFEVERANWNVEKLKHEEEVRSLREEIEDLKEEIRELQAYLEETENNQQQAKQEIKAPSLTNNQTDLGIIPQSEFQQAQQESKLSPQDANLPVLKEKLLVDNTLQPLCLIEGSNITGETMSTSTSQISNINEKLGMTPQQLADPKLIERSHNILEPEEESLLDRETRNNMDNTKTDLREPSLITSAIGTSDEGNLPRDIALESRDKEILDNSNVPRRHENRERPTAAIPSQRANLVRSEIEGSQVTEITDTLLNQQQTSQIPTTTSTHSSPSVNVAVAFNSPASTETQRSTGVSGQLPSVVSNISTRQNISKTSTVTSSTDSKFSLSESAPLNSNSNEGMTPRTPIAPSEKVKTLTSPIVQRDPQLDKIMADLKNQNKELIEKLTTSKMETAEMLKSVYNKMGAKVTENMKLKMLLEENGISYGEDESNLVGGKPRSILTTKKGDGSGAGSKQSSKEKHDAFMKEKQELKRKMSVMSRNMTNLTEEYEKAISQYNALTLNYKIEKNKFLKELGRKDMELEQMSKVLTYRTIHEGEIQKKLDEVIEMNEMLKKTLEEKMRNVVVGGARVIRGGGSQASIRGGISGGGMSGGSNSNFINSNTSTYMNANTNNSHYGSVSGGNTPNSNNNMNNNNAMKSQLSIDIPKTPSGGSVISPSLSMNNTPLSAYKSASSRSFMTQSKLTTSSTTSIAMAVAASVMQVNSPSNTSQAGSAPGSQDATPSDSKPRRKSFSGLRRKIEGSKN